MFYSPKLYFRDPWTAWPLVGTILIQAFLWWSLIFYIRPDAGQVFLHYNIVLGVDLVGDRWQIFYLPATGVLVLLINYLFSSGAYLFDKFLARFLSFWVLFFHIFLLVGVWLLVRLNS